jgi:glycosyltransferase involved in cell wall biosynthesis
MEIHQVLVSASPGDAIFNSASEIRSLLRRIGPSEIYARYIHPGVAAEVLPLHAYARRSLSRPDQDVLLFHASIGEPEVFSFLRSRAERLVLMYHNIAPSAMFMAYDPAFAGLLEAGRRELVELRGRVSMAIAASEFNGHELRGLGYPDVRVVPLIVDTERLAALDPDPQTTNHLEQHVHGTVFLFVGQLLPHKRPDYLVQAFHILSTYLDSEAHLILVGSPRLPRYRDHVQGLIEELNLPRAWVTGSLSDASLNAFYRRADVFVTASEHEGFCVPLLEALSFEVPVVARSFGAVPETLGDAGLLLPPDGGPMLMAEAMIEMAENRKLRDHFTEKGNVRRRHFDPDRSRADILRCLGELV